jgi:hypothetical protein
LNPGCCIDPPDKERQAEPCHSRGSQSVRRGDEIHPG